MYSLSKTIEHKFVFAVTELEDAVVIAITENIFNWKRVSSKGFDYDPDPVIDKKINTIKTWEVCVTPEEFKQKKIKYQSDPSWVLEDIDRSYVGITEKFLQHYQSAEYNLTYEGMLNSKKTSDLLKSGKSHLVIYNNTHDGYLYNLKGKKICKKFSYNYIDSYLRESKCHINELADCLKNCPEIENVKIITIPYYNADFEGERAIEFTHAPSQENFEVYADLVTSYDRMQFLSTMLELEKFKK